MITVKNWLISAAICVAAFGLMHLVETPSESAVAADLQDAISHAGCSPDCEEPTPAQLLNAYKEELK